MSSFHNVILVIAIGAQWICQGITVDPSNQQKVFLVLPKTTPLPPQLAYYVQGGRPSDSVYNSNNYFGKSAAPSNGGALSVIGPTYSQKTIKPRLQNSNFGFVRNHKYTQNPTSNQPQIYQPIVNDPSGSYNFRQYYEPNLESIVRATPPPERRPGRTPPPPSKKVTFQVNMIERNYRAQQEFEQRNRDPHYRNQAIRQVESPSLATEAPKVHQVLRNNIKQLKKTHKEHFNVDEDEHPAHQSINDGDDDAEPVTPRYDYKFENLDKVRDEESRYSRLKKGYGQNDEASSNYEESEPKFTNFYDEIDEATKYLSHADFVTPTSYQSYNNDHDDHVEIPNFSSKYKSHDYDNSDRPSSEYGYEDNNDNENRGGFNPYKTTIDSYGHKRFITNEEVKQFDKYLRSKPRYVGPKKKQRIESEDRSDNDRSDKGNDGDFVPYKMLASVRHSERYEHQPKDLSNPLLKERILEKGGHVVYTEQGYEDKQFDHGNEEKFANIKHRKRRHVSEYKFPFYYSSNKKIPKYSAIRYASIKNGEHLHNDKAPFYNTKRKRCDDVDFDDKNVNDKQVDFKSKKRLIGLEDKIDCLKEKLFGAEPLSNPIFQEQFVDETVPVVKNRRARNSFHHEPYSTLVNVFDDVTSNIERSSTSHSKSQNNPLPSESKIDYVVFPPYIDLEHSKMNSKNRSVLDIVARERFNQTEPPVVILMDGKSFAQMSKKDSKAKVLHYLKYPQSDGTEVFIFDISKFIPKLTVPVNEEYYDSVTTESPDITITPNKRKNFKKSLDFYIHSPERNTDVVRSGIELAKVPYLLSESYNLHTQGNLYR